MYMSKKLEKELEFVIEWSKQREINKMLLDSPDQRALQAFVDLEVYCIKAKRERIEFNAKCKEIIDRKRKSDPNYARPRKEWK